MILAVTALVWAAFTPDLFAQKPGQGVAIVGRIEGAARYTTGDNIWQPLRSGMVLRPGAVIQTAQNSQVDLIFSEREVGPPPETTFGHLVYRPGEADVRQNVIRLRENTLLAIDKLSWEDTGADVVTETMLDLRAGRVFGSVKKQTAGSKYEIKIPAGVASIRGTVFELSADGIVSVYAGTVVMAYMQPDGTVATRIIVAGQRFNLRTGELITIPEMIQRSEIGESKLIGAGVGPFVEPVVYPQDRTRIYVSPVIGRPSNN